MNASGDEPPIDVARGDAAVSRQLRRSLEALRARSDNAEFQRLVDDVLAGRTGLRDAYRSPAFESVLNPLVHRFAERYDALSDDERRQLAEQGEQQLEEERARIAQEQSD